MFVSVESTTFSLVILEAAPAKDAAIEQLQKQIDNIVQELNLLKEQQALQTGDFTLQLTLTKESMQTFFFSTTLRPNILSSAPT